MKQFTLGERREHAVHIPLSVHRCLYFYLFYCKSDAFNSEIESIALSLHTAIFCFLCSFLSYSIPSLSLIFPFSIFFLISFFHLISSINLFNLFYLSIYLSYIKVILFSFAIAPPLREDLKSMYYSFFLLQFC